MLQQERDMGGVDASNGINQHDISSEKELLYCKELWSMERVGTFICQKESMGLCVRLDKGEIYPSCFKWCSFNVWMHVNDLIQTDK